MRANKSQSTKYYRPPAKLRTREGMSYDQAKLHIANVAKEYGARFILEELKTRFEPRALTRALNAAFKKETLRKR